MYNVVDPLGLCPCTVVMVAPDPEVEVLPKKFQGSMSSDIGSNYAKGY